jgi:thiol-disulfide isomerase/thioredoxin
MKRMVRMVVPRPITRRRSISWFAALGAFGAAAARPGAAGATLTETNAAPPGGKAPDKGAEKAQANEWRPWPATRVVPKLALPRLEGGRFDLRELRGRPALINFWASWCAPCREEMPSLARLASARAGDGLVVIAINYRESAATVRRFLESLGAPLPAVLPVLLDQSGEAAKAWTPRIFPTTVFIDRRGRPIGSLVGECDWDSTTALERVVPLLASG